MGYILHGHVCYIKVGFNGVYITWACFPDVLKEECLGISQEDAFRAH